MAAHVVARKKAWLRSWALDPGPQDGLADFLFPEVQLFGDSLEARLVETRQKESTAHSSEGGEKMLSEFFVSAEPPQRPEGFQVQNSNGNFLTSFCSGSAA